MGDCPVTTRSRCAGYTLVELAVGAAIGILVTAAAIAILLGGVSAYETQANHARSHENARFVVERLARDLRMAGYFGCLGSGGTVVNGLNHAGGSLHDTGNPLEGFDGDDQSRTWHPSGALLDVNHALPGTDAVTLRFVDPDRSVPILPGGAGISIDPGSANFEAGEIVVAADCDHAEVFQATSISADGGISRDPGTGHLPGNRSAASASASGTGHGPGAELAPLVAVRYFVGERRDGDRASRALYRRYLSRSGRATTEAVADGVDDLQLLYGEDADGDGRADRYVAADDVGAWTRVRAVAAEVVVRSAGTGDASDESPRGRHRYSATVLLRNPR